MPAKRAAKTFDYPDFAEYDLRHNPGYDFNDTALPLGASLFARLVEKKLARV